VIPAVILAAGLSSRMGRAKALLPLGSTTFIARIVHTFLGAGVSDLIVVLGHDAAAIERRMEDDRVPARVVVNEQYESGQFSSLLAGLHAVDRPGVRAMLLTLVDVPLVASSTVRAVIDRHRESGAPIVRPTRGDDHGHPVLIDRSLFAELRGTDPSAGAKPVIRAHATVVGNVPIDDDGAFLDVDTPEEYARLLDRIRA
jgi:molybdenum cofactor cytidylyltransferase